jgi:hypothetical protein
VVAPRVDRIVRICCVATIIACSLLILTFGYGRDQGIYAVVARGLLHGEMPYRDVWDFKPPGIFLVYAAARALLGSSQLGIRIVEVAGLFAGSWGLVWLAARWWEEPLVGYVAAMLWAIMHAQLEFWHTAQPESFGGMITVGALCCAFGKGRPHWRWFAAGALLGFAGLLKPPLVGGAGVLALVFAARAGRSRRALIPIAVVGAGVLVPVTGCLVWFAAAGALGDLRDVLLVFTPEYTKLGWRGVSLASQLSYGLRDWMIGYSAVLPAGMLALLVFRPAKREQLGIAVLSAIIALHVVGCVMQAKFFAYHWGATWPLTALLAALGLVKVWRWAVGRGAAFAGAVVVAAIALGFAQSATKDVGSFSSRVVERFGLVATGPTDHAALDRLATVNGVDAGVNRRVADYLRTHVPAGRTVFVWGFEPVIYDLADRDPASRFIYDVPQRVTWVGAEMRARMMADLATTHPAAIIVEHGDVFPQVTGNFEDSAGELTHFPALARLLQEQFALSVRIADCDIYLALSLR